MDKRDILLSCARAEDNNDVQCLPEHNNLMKMFLLLI